MGELNEVTVSAKGSARSGRERKANILIFEPDFLGRTMNAMKCDIINEYDITLNYNLSNDHGKESELIIRCAHDPRGRTCRA